MKKINQIFAFITVFSVLISLSVNAQDTISDPPGTVITQIPLTGPAMGNPAGKSFVYTNPTWPSYETPCLLWGVPDTLTEIINGNNSLPPNQPCSGLSDLVFNATLSSLASGVAVYTGSTNYYHMDAGGTYVTNSLSVRLTLTVTTTTSLAIPLIHNNKHVFIPVNGDFEANILLTTYAPVDAMYIGANLGNTWVPSVSLYDALHTHPNRSICTSWEEASFYEFIVNGSVASASPYCVGDNIVLTSTGGDNYKWDGPNSFSSTIATPIILNSNTTHSGMYTVEISDAIYGCPDIDTLDIVVNSLPTIIANASTNPICYDDTLVLTGSGGASYVWNNSAINGVGFPALSSTTYTVTGTDTNGCENTGNISVTVNPLPNPVITFSDDTICLGESITLSGIASYINTWSNGVVDGVSFVPTGSFVFTLTSTDANGCSDSNTIGIHVHSLPNVVATATPDVLCLGESTVLTGSGADTLNWANGVIDGASFVPLLTDDYYLEGIDANGCVNYDTVQVWVNDLPIPQLGSDTSLCVGRTITLDPGGGFSGYNWSSGANSSTIDVDGGTVGTGIFDYWVMVTDSNGCEGGDTIQIEFTECVSVVEIEEDIAVKLYPNPVQEILNIEILENVSESVQIEVFDVNGRQITELQQAVNSGIIQIDMNQQSSGVYIIRIETNSAVKSIRVVKN